MDPEAIRRRIGRNVRRLAEERGLSLNELCIEADVTRSALFKALSAESSMTVDTLTRVATALGVEPWVLLRADAAEVTKQLAAKKTH